MPGQSIVTTMSILQPAQTSTLISEGGGEGVVWGAFMSCWQSTEMYGYVYVYLYVSIQRQHTTQRGTACEAILQLNSAYKKKYSMPSGL